MNLDRPLQQVLRALAPELPVGVCDRLVAFLRLLERWNRRYNLTAVRDLEQMIPRHLLDSLSVLPELRGPEVLDVGTGAGFPGIPLAVARPDLRFTLLDSNGKKTRFVTQAVHELALTNVTVVQERVERFRADPGFDTLVARAFVNIPDMLAGTASLRRDGGRLVVMKGALPREELAGLASAHRIEVKAVRVPGLDAERHLIIITQG